MRLNKIHILLAAALLVAAVSCKKEDEKDVLVNRTFQTSLEKPDPDSNGDQDDDMFEQYAKNYLAMERYIYWEETDQVAVFAGIGPETNPSPNQVQDITVSVQSNPRYANINCSGIQYDADYYGIFPASARVGGNPEKITFLDTYTYRDNTSFPSPGIPMVAWDGRGSGSPALDFHSVCGLVRIQITSEEAATVQAVKFFEGGKDLGHTVLPISGVFHVRGIQTYTPYVEPVAKEEKTTITFNSVNQSIGPGQLLTFYLPLPALQATGNPAEPYYIGMAVKATKGGSEVVFKKVFHVKVRRNTMSFLRAITIKDWSADGAIETGLVGEGTETKPFQIYSQKDMETVRDAFEETNPTINGIAVTSNTVFRVVRADIELTTSNWTKGISNFKGKFTFQTANNQVGIKNNSDHPIFESISSQGRVEDVSVKRDASVDYTGSKPFSPFCYTNSGIIDNCHNLSPIRANNYNLAGICVNNTSSGIIVNSSNAGILTVTGSGHAAGICIKNSGTIECYETSAAKVNASQSSGICDSNAGVIRNTQVAYSRADVTQNYGGIAYVNLQGGTITSCQVLGTLVSTAQIGGICHTNQGLIDFCRNGLTLLRGATYVGGIAAYQSTIGTPEIRNCFNSSASHADITASSGVVGGIIGYLNGGKVYNCYCTSEVQSANATYYGVIAGDVHGGDVQNCYNGSGLAQFYGSTTTHPIGINCFNPSAYQYCCEYVRSTGKINTLTTGSYGAVNGNMYDALNAWVRAKGSNYFSWTTNAALPAFTNAK